jgi:hypothetical protein
MKTIETLLEEFDAVLRKYNLPNYSKLYPPLPEDEIIDCLNQLKLKDNDFRSLYRWKNGFDPDGKVIGACQIFIYHAPLSLDSIIRKVNSAKKTSIWKDAFIPLIADTTGDYLLFNNQEGNDYGKIHLYSVSLFFIDEPISYYDSLGAMIETTIQSYINSAFKYNAAKQRLEVDAHKHHEIAKEINVNSKIWTFEDF